MISHQTAIVVILKTYLYIGKQDNNGCKFRYHLEGRRSGCFPSVRNMLPRLQNQCTVVKQVVNKGFYKTCDAFFYYKRTSILSQLAVYLYQKVCWIHFVVNKNNPENLRTESKAYSGIKRDFFF